MPTPSTSSDRTFLGVERLFEDEFDQIEGKRVGLITNHSGTDSRLRATADLLHCHPDVELAALFGPEHGIRGDAADGAKVGDARDPQTDVPVYSLYGATNKPTDAMLEGLDAVLFDIQDVGARFYTYLYTMSLAMEACADRDLPFIVLDRPNPIGDAIEGNLLEAAFVSFVGRHPIPVRYGLSIGETARLFNREYGIDAPLHVVGLQGWRRDSYWEETGLPWVAPSPAMPTVDTAIAYPGTCFFEGTNVSEGRGTAKPFEQFGAPYIDGQRLAETLNHLELPGALFRPVFFTPHAGKHAGENCGGVQVHVTDRRAFLAVRTGFECIAAVRRLWPSAFAWHLPGTGIYNFDRLAGSQTIRLHIESGAPVADLAESWQANLKAFDTVRRRHLLY
jgi:uncharacterized protein YbbC (DUF1343 family)